MPLLNAATSAASTFLLSDLPMAASPTVSMKEEEGTAAPSTATPPAPAPAPAPLAASSEEAAPLPQHAGSSPPGPASPPPSAGGGGGRRRDPSASPTPSGAKEMTIDLPARETEAAQMASPVASGPAPGPGSPADNEPAASASASASAAATPPVPVPAAAQEAPPSSAAKASPPPPQLSPGKAPTAEQVTALASFAALLSSAETNGVGHAAPTSLTEFLAAADAGKDDHETRKAGSFPSMDLRNSASGTSSSSSSSGDLSLQDAAALNLAAPLAADRDELEKVPARLLKNCSASFLKLVDSRLRSSVSALLRQIAKLGTSDDSSGEGAGGGGLSSSETGIIVKLLSQGDPIKVTTVVTSFRVLPTETQTRSVGENGRDGRSSVRQDLTLPLIFEAVIDASALGKLVTVSLQAPGTITGSFPGGGGSDDNNGSGRSGGKLSHVKVTFDTLALLKSMMEQARSVVKKAVSRAATVAAAASKAARAKEEAIKKVLEDQRRAREEKEEQERRRREEKEKAERLLLAQQREVQETHQRQQQLARSGTAASFARLANALARHNSSEVFGKESNGGAVDLHNHQDLTHNYERSNSDNSDQSGGQNPFASHLNTFPQHLRETMMQLVKENPPPPQAAPRQDAQMQTQQATLFQGNDWLHRPHGGNNDHEGDDDDDTDHSPPLTLSSLYEREDREKKEAEERATKLKALAASSNDSSGVSGASARQGNKIELFSWLKGDSMLLSEEEDELGLHAAAAAAATSSQASSQQAIPQGQMAPAAVPPPLHQQLQFQLQQQQQGQGLPWQQPQQQLGGNQNFNNLQQQAQQFLQAQQLQHQQQQQAQQLLQAQQLQNQIEQAQLQQQSQELQGLGLAHLQNLQNLKTLQNAQLILGNGGGSSSHSLSQQQPPQQQQAQQQLQQQLLLNKQDISGASSASQSLSAVTSLQNSFAAAPPPVNGPAHQSLSAASNLQDSANVGAGGLNGSGSSLGAPAAFAAGQLPPAFSALTPSEMMLAASAAGLGGVGGAAGSGAATPMGGLGSAGSSTLSLAPLQTDSDKRSSLASCLLSGGGATPAGGAGVSSSMAAQGNASFSSLLKSVASVTSTANLPAAGNGGEGRKRVSFSSMLGGGTGSRRGSQCSRNDSFDSSSSAGSNKRMKKQVSFGLTRHNDAFDV